jgi:hypothetical protein
MAASLWALARHGLCAGLRGPIPCARRQRSHGGDRQIVMAVGGAYPESPRRYCSNALVTHMASDAATARHIPPGAQGRVDPGRNHKV